MSSAANDNYEEIGGGNSRIRTMVIATMVLAVLTLAMVVVQFAYTISTLKKFTTREAMVLEGTLTKIPLSESVLVSDRRLVDTAPAVTETYFEKAAVDAVIQAFSEGQQNFMVKLSETRMVDFKMDDLSTNQHQSNVADRPDGNNVNVQLAAFCKEGSDHCSIIFPSKRGNSAQVSVTEDGKVAVLTEGGRRLLVTAATATIIGASITAGATVAVGAGSITQQAVADGCYPADMEVTVLDAAAGPKKVPVASLMVGDQVLTVNLATHALQFEPLLLDFHSHEENSARHLSYLRLVHKGGFLDISPNHFVDSLEYGMTLARNVMVGDHIYTLQNETNSTSLTPSRILGREVVVKNGMYAKLTNSGTLIVNGVLVSSYTDDEVRTFLPEHAAEKLRSLLGGYRGIHYLIHMLAAPIRWAHTYLPSWFVKGPFWSPSVFNKKKTTRQDSLPLYIDYLGKSVAWFVTSMM